MSPRDFLDDNQQNTSIPSISSGSPRDFLSENENQGESLGMSLGMAIPRVLGDLGKAAYNGVQEIPGMYQSAKSEVPGLLSASSQHPGHLAMQGLAGANELINSLAQTPLNLAQYGANRLNLLPQAVPNAISKITPEDTTQAINQLFGDPKYPGEALFRGIPRNTLNILGGAGVAKMLLKPVNGIRNIYKIAGENPIQEPIPNAPVFNEPTYSNKYEFPAQKEILETAPGVSKQFLSDLGKNSLNKEESTSKLASFIRDAHNNRVEQSSPYFQFPMKQAGNERLYENVNPLISTNLDKEMHMMNKLDSLNVKPLYEIFKKNPTIANAHNLKSELGSALGDLEKNLVKTPSDRATISNISNTRKQLESDILDAFKRHDMSSNENLTPLYQKGVELHNEHVAPFRATPELRQITRKGIETPKNIENIFNTPTNIIKNNKTTVGPINKIIGDMPEDAKDLILFNKIGANQYLDNPKKLIDLLENARNDGYSSYFTPKTEQHIADIKNAIKNDELNSSKIKMENKKLIEDARNNHKDMIKELRLNHKNEVKNALLEHKKNVETIKGRNSLNLDKQNVAKKKRSLINTLVAGSVGAGYVYPKVNHLLSNENK